MVIITISAGRSPIVSSARIVTSAETMNSFMIRWVTLSCAVSP